MRILVRAILLLQIIGTVLISIVIQSAQGDDSANWCYHLFNTNPPFVWRVDDLTTGNFLIVQDPVIQGFDQLRLSSDTRFALMRQRIKFSDLRWHWQPGAYYGIYWSPDLRYLVYLTTEGQLILRDVLGNVIAQRVINQPVSTYPQTKLPSYAELYQFSADGHYLAYYTEREFHILTIPDLQPWRVVPIPSKSGDQTIFSESPDQTKQFLQVGEQITITHGSQIYHYVSENYLDYSYLQWSPDQQFLYVSYYRHGNYSGAIYNINGDAPLIFNNERAFYGWWNDRLLINELIEGHYRLLAYDLQTDTSEVLITEADIFLGRSPSMPIIAFRRDEDGYPVFMLFNLKTRVETRLTRYHRQIEPDQGMIHWSTDGQAILWYTLYDYIGLNVAEQRVTFGLALRWNDVGETWWTQNADILYVNIDDGARSLHLINTLTGESQMLLPYVTKIYATDDDGRYEHNRLWFYWDNGADSGDFIIHELDNRIVYYTNAAPYRSFGLISPDQRHHIRTGQQLLAVVSPDQTTTFTGDYDRIFAEWSPDSRYLMINNQTDYQVFDTQTRLIRPLHGVKSDQFTQGNWMLCDVLTEQS